MAVTRRRRAWLLPVVFLAGYLLAWATVLVDRQMLIEEQRRLQEEVERTRIELRIMGMVDEYNEDYGEQVEWNKEAIKPAEERTKR